MKGWGAVSLAILLFAGCMEAAEGEARAPPQGAASSGDLVLQPLPAQTTPRGLMEPPNWQLGEWWRFRVEVHVTDMPSFTFKRVVVGGEGDHYLVGYVIEDERIADDLIAIHLPAVGEVGRADLSWLVHDVPFVPVRFPLTSATTWATSFENLADNTSVTIVNDSTARISYGAVGDGTYDAEIGELSALWINGYAEFRVVDHGYEHQGIVVLPKDVDFLFAVGRFAGALGYEGLTPDPRDSAYVNDTFDRMTFNFFMGNFPLDPTGVEPPGIHSERAVAPDGTVYERMYTPADPGGLHSPAFHHDKPGGMWRFEHIAAGYGGAATEAMAYAVYEIELPSLKITRPLAVN